MSTIIIAALSLVVGGVAGYFLRIAISLGQKGGVELEIKQKMIEAKEDAQKIISEANEKAAGMLREVEEEEKKKRRRI
jgi:hypothetical protein